jgi:hypothetical protein
LILSWTVPTWRTSGINSGPVDERAVGAVQVFDVQLAVFVGDQAVLAAGPDPVGGFLVVQVDIDRLLVGAAHEVVPFVEGILDVDLQTAEHDKFRGGAFGEFNRCGRLAGRGSSSGGGSGGDGRTRGGHGSQVRRGAGWDGTQIGLALLAKQGPIFIGKLAERTGHWHGK